MRISASARKHREYLEQTRKDQEYLDEFLSPDLPGIDELSVSTLGADPIIGFMRKLKSKIDNMEYQGKRYKKHTHCWSFELESQLSKYKRLKDEAEVKLITQYELNRNCPVLPYQQSHVDDLVNKPPKRWTNQLNRDFKEIRDKYDNLNQGRNKEEEIRDLLGTFYYNKKVELSDYQKVLRDEMRMRTKASRLSDIGFRLMLELIQAIQENRFIIFNTLTLGYVSDQVFRGKEWKNYYEKMRQIDRNHRIYTCYELGSKNGRPHLHTIQSFTKVPREWLVDPYNQKDVGNREDRIVSALGSASGTKYWPDRSTPLMVRIEGGRDRWSQEGIKWPLNQEDGFGTIAGTVGRLSNYVSSYLKKSEEEKWINKDNKKQKIRTKRPPRHMGKPIVMKVLKRLTLRELRVMESHPDLNLTLSGKRISKSVFKKFLLEEIMSRIQLKEQSRLRSIMVKKEPAKNFYKQQLSLIQKKQKSKSQNIGNSETIVLSEMDSSKLIREQIELKKKLKRVFQDIEREYSIIPPKFNIDWRPGALL